MQHPNAKFIGSNKRKGGDPRRDDLPARGVIHTWEGRPSKAQMKDHPWPYHLVVDIVNRIIYQLLPLDRTAYALKGYASMSAAYRKKYPAFETNHAGRFCIQVCLMGFAKDMHKLSQEDLDWLAEKVFAPLNELCGIKNEFDVPLGSSDGVLAVETYAGRKTPNEWYKFDGWATHQTSPGQDHWDPGRLNTKYIQKRIRELSEGSTLPAMMDWARHYNDLPFGKGYDPIVEFIQRGLRSLGHYDGPIDGAKTRSVDDGVHAFEVHEFGEGPNVNADFGKVSWPRFLERISEPSGPKHGIGGMSEEELRQHFDVVAERLAPDDDESLAKELSALAVRTEQKAAIKRAAQSMLVRLREDVVG